MAETAITCGRWRSFRATLRLRVLEVGLRDVPLVERDHGRALLLHRQLGHAQVLAGDALAGVADHDRHVRALGGLLGAQLRVVVDGAGDLRAPAQPGGVHQDHLRPSNSIRVSIASRVVPATSVTITRSSPSSRFTSDDLPTFGRPISASRVAALAGVLSRPPAGARRSGRAGRRCRGPGWRTPAAGRRARGRRTRCAPGLAGVVDLVRRHDHGHAATAQLSRELGVARAQPGARVHDEQREVGVLERRQRLAADLLGHLVLAGEVHAARVDQREADSVPVGVDLLAVARDARLLVHHGLARAGEPVHERRLADVRIADDRDGWGRLIAAPASTRSTIARPPRRREPVVSSSTASGAAAAASARGAVLRVAERLVAETVPRPCRALRAPAGALLGRCREEDLHRRARRHHRADVAALGHPIAAREQLALLLDERLADLRVGRHREAASDTSGVRIASVTSSPFAITRSPSSMSSSSARSQAALRGDSS